ncbi:hypothetical protein [Nannocystis punicea]|uniref:Uncharacterized protein n=1 Tax=Nannocystis punicea TaxID=2995304 RepID=A0ABY7H7R5_9BACT|nr:hypothetical protein [Nannocystis poenicansa]WAS95311.1 hypothetical protein O0S08_04055 [Nannocystis poenicansa]
MAQVFGQVRGDGSVANDSGGFTVQKLSTGTYFINTPDTNGQVPIVVAMPGNAYTTAAVRVQEYGPGGVTVCTGFTDQRGNLDCDFFFIAMWP